MAGGCLAKPLSGALLYKLRSRILNIRAEDIAQYKVEYEKYVTAKPAGEVQIRQPVKQ